MQQPEWNQVLPGTTKKRQIGLDINFGPAYIVSKENRKMNLIIRGKKIELDKPVQTYVSKKISGLNRILPSIIETKVEIYREKAKSPRNRYIVQITVNSNGTLIRAEEKEADLYAAVDAAVDVIRRQVRRHKDRFYLKSRRSDRHKREVQPSIEAIEEGKIPDKVVRTKRFSVKVMTMGEATEQMELLGHDFFIFLNASTNDINVLYRRKDGNYGLIEPELA